MFSATIDRNGYVPIQNPKYSQPQGSDPVWNAANSRNRRFFNDRNAKALANLQAPVMLRTYRRDMGGGRFQFMKYCAASIFVRGRRWGGISMGFA